MGIFCLLAIVDVLALLWVTYLRKGDLLFLHSQTIVLMELYPSLPDSRYVWLMPGQPGLYTPDAEINPGLDTQTHQSQGDMRCRRTSFLAKVETEMAEILRTFLRMELTQSLDQIFFSPSSANLSGIFFCQFLQKASQLYRVDLFF